MHAFAMSDFQFMVFFVAPRVRDQTGPSYLQVGVLAGLAKYGYYYVTSLTSVRSAKEKVLKNNFTEKKNHFIKLSLRQMVLNSVE